MANATLQITATVTNGSMTRAIELQLLEQAARFATADVRGGGGKKISGTPYLGEYAASGVSVTYTYSPVAST
jgi:hypothetical protein